MAGREDERADSFAIQFAIEASQMAKAENGVAPHPLVRMAREPDTKVLGELNILGRQHNVDDQNRQGFRVVTFQRAFDRSRSPFIAKFG